MSRLVIKAKCMKVLNEAGRVGTDDEAIQHGKNFYKFMFGHHPDLRVFFKGNSRENEVKTLNCKFPGQKVLLAVRIIINTYDDPETFRAYARETVNRHIKFKIDRALWLAFFTVLVNSLKEHTIIDEETEKAFLQIGKEFSDECLKHIVALNLHN
ncbi:globin family protein [Wuchereria bancrofti]|uniref:Globin family protein n=1 Tax=Wuchereria bancrofti TaxID=6293 RepID=J9EH55_WUCBA|nr:globin family protein [Wuchereria bancrofti]